MTEVLQHKISEGYKRVRNRSIDELFTFVCALSPRLREVVINWMKDWTPGNPDTLDLVRCTRWWPVKDKVRAASMTTDIGLQEILLRNVKTSKQDSVTVRGGEN